MHSLTYSVRHSIIHSMNSTVLLQKLIAFQLVKKSHAFHETQRYVISFSTAQLGPFPEPNESFWRIRKIAKCDY